MKSLKNFYQTFVSAGDSFQDFLLLAIRLYWGIMLAFIGWTKLQHISSTEQAFAHSGVPLAHYAAYLVAYTELIGGSLLALGWFSRLITVPLIILFISAYFIGHFEAVKNMIANHKNFVAQEPFNFLLASLIIFAFGAGRFSLDNLLGRFVK